MSNNLDISDLDMEVDSVGDNSKLRYVFIISCHGIEANQSEDRYYYSAEDVIFKNLGWISTGNNLSAYVDEVNSKVFNSTSEKSFELLKTINTEVCMRDQQPFLDGFITNVTLPPMLFEFREVDKMNNDKMMADRMGLYFATLEETNYTDNEGKETVKYTTKNLEHVVHFNNLVESRILNVNIINEGIENHIETYCELDQQHPWQKIFGMANKILLKKMEEGIINEEDLNNNVYFRMFCCRSTLRIDETINQPDRSMKSPLLIKYNKYYKPIEKEMTENVYLYNEILDTTIYDQNVALRLHDICFYPNPINRQNLFINYDEEVLRIYYMLMVNINPYFAIPSIRNNIQDYERQTIISFPSDKTNSVVYKLTAMLTREKDNKNWSIPLIGLPLDNTSYQLCESISNILLQDQYVRRSYFIAYRDDPSNNEKERGTILSIYGYLTQNQLRQPIGVIEIIQYNLDITQINYVLNQEEITNMLRNNTHKITYTYNLNTTNVEVDKCNLVLNSINKLNQDYDFTHIHLLFKDIPIYIGGMNNNSLNKYNPNALDKNKNEKMQVVKEIESNADDIQLLTGQIYPGLRQPPFTSLSASEKNIKNYTNENAESFFYNLQPPEEEHMDVEYNPSDYAEANRATKHAYDSQNTDVELSTPRTPDRPPTKSRYTTPNQQGIIRSPPSSNVSGRTTLPGSLPGSPSPSYSNKRGPGSPGRRPGGPLTTEYASSAPTSPSMEEMMDLNSGSDDEKLPPGSTGGKKQKVKSKKSLRKKNYVPIITSKKIKLTKKCYQKKKGCCCDLDTSKCSIHKCKPKTSSKQTKKNKKK